MPGSFQGQGGWGFKQPIQRKMSLPMAGELDCMIFTGPFQTKPIHDLHLQLPLRLASSTLVNPSCLQNTLSCSHFFQISFASRAVNLDCFPGGVSEAALLWGPQKRGNRLHIHLTSLWFSCITCTRTHGHLFLTTVEKHFLIPVSSKTKIKRSVKTDCPSGMQSLPGGGVVLSTAYARLPLTPAPIFFLPGQCIFYYALSAGSDSLSFLYKTAVQLCWALLPSSACSHAQ